MAGGKRKHRGLQTYGRSNNYKHAHQRVGFLRAQELFFPNSDQPSQHLDTAPDHGHSTGASKQDQSRLEQTPSSGATAGRKHTAQSLEPKLNLNPKAKPTTTSAKPKSAKMAVEPSEEDIGSVVAIVDCSRDQAIRYLKVKKDVSAALNAIMDGEDISKQEQENQWDESAWTSDRNGNPATGDNNLHPLGGTSTAPTRVPSPAMNTGVPANRDDEDAQLLQALAASREGTYQWETGIIHANGTSEQTYGPVNKDQSAHDRQWGMVLSSQNASSEIVPDVERPEERKNVEGEPRFLKTLPSGDYLPNFLTIGHSIPAVREALLMRDYQMVNYGSDPEWWKGNSIALPKIVHTADGAPANSAIDRFDEFIAETQRLMAALDASQRSYASVNALTKTELLLSGDNNTLTENFINRFCDSADAHTNDHEKLMSLFMTYVGTTSPEGMRTPYAAVFALDIKTMGEEKIQLMEVLDSLLWETDVESYESGDNYITNAGDVIVMQARATDPSAEKLKLEVPPTLYIDKYLEKNLDISRPARLEIAKEKERVAKINEIENKLTKWQISGRQVNARDMLQHTLGHFSGKNMADAGNVDIENGVVVNGTSAPEQPHYADIAAKLETIIANVDKKLERLAEQKESIKKNISKLSNSSPSQLQQDGLKERYTLMGVATKPSITYVLRPKEEQEEDDDHMSTDNDDEATPDGMQWWRIEYVVNGSQPRISKAKVEGDIVIQAVEVEHTSALLVYASDRAVDVPDYDPSLPPALQQFIDEDDLHLNVELHDAMRSQPPPAYDYAQEGDIPRPSIEPGARRPSMDSTIAELDGASTRGSPISGPAYYANPPPGAGMPPAITSSAEHVENPEEVTEIHLSPSEEAEEGGAAQHQEMVETRREPFVPGLQQARRSDERDAAMEEARDDKRQEW